MTIYEGPKQANVAGIIVPVDASGNVRFDQIHPAYRPPAGKRFGIIGGWECAQPSGGHPIKGTYWDTKDQRMKDAWNRIVDESETARRMLSSAQVDGYKVPAYITTNAGTSFAYETNPTDPGATNSVPYKEINPLTRFYQQQPVGQCYPGNVASVVLLIAVYDEPCPCGGGAIDPVALAKEVAGHLKLSAEVSGAVQV